MWAWTILATVPAGAPLSSVMTLANKIVVGGGSFVAFQEGPVVTVQPNGIGAGGLLGFWIYEPHGGSNILQYVVPGLDKTLSEGTYSVW